MENLTDADAGPTSREGAGFVAIPLWVLRSGISGQALKLYAHLAAMTPPRPPIPGVMVLQPELAAFLGLANGAAARRYVDELVDAGALVVEEVRTHDGMRRRNRYSVVRDKP